MQSGGGVEVSSDVNLKRKPLKESVLSCVRSDLALRFSILALRFEQFRLKRRIFISEQRNRSLQVRLARLAANSVKHPLNNKEDDPAANGTRDSDRE